jgi:hypothetical protein
MGQTQSAIKIGFEDMQYSVKHIEENLIINTLDTTEQNCLIKGTLTASQEEDIVNKYLISQMRKIRVIIYGRNCNDEKIYIKYKQFFSLGFSNIYIYTGGLFEWLLLQDIYGMDEFPTTSKQNDIIKYKPNKILGVPLLEY